MSRCLSARRLCTATIATYVVFLSACGGGGSSSTPPMGGSLGTSVSTPTPTSTPSPTPAPTPNPTARNYTLYIVSGQWIVNPLVRADGSSAGGATFAEVSYSDIASATKIPGPTLSGNVGDAFSVTVINNDVHEHNFVVPGVATDVTPIAAGGRRTYYFTVQNAGTYLYNDTLNGDVNRELGLYGMLWIGPRDGSARAWDAGPGYDFQRLWVLSDIDTSHWNDIVAAGGTVETAIYKPNYFLMNGQGGYDAMRNPATRLDGVLGQSCLIRIANAGQFPESLHFHGNHVQVLALNGAPQSAPYKLLDVVNVPPLSTVDVLYFLSQRGDYPMHNHTAQMETANGVYLNGVGTMIHVQ